MVVMRVILIRKPSQTFKNPESHARKDLRRLRTSPAGKDCILKNPDSWKELISRLRRLRHCAQRRLRPSVRQRRAVPRQVLIRSSG